MKKRIVTFLVLFVTLISLSTVANAQVVGDVSLGPRPALRDDDLTCSVTGGSRNQEYYWYKNGVKIDSLTDTKIPDNSRNSILGAGNTSSTNTWTCEVVTWPDHMLIGSDSVYIEDTEPVNAQIIPDPAYTNDNLTCDHDGTVTYVYEWYLNSALQPGLTTQEIDSSNTAKSDVWTCFVIHGLVGVKVGEDNISVSNLAPVLDPIGIQTVAEDNVLNFVLTGTDADSDLFNFTLNTNTTNGNVTLDNIIGAVSYIPNGNYAGQDSFEMYLTDGQDNGAIETIEINVTPVNDAPVFDHVLEDQIVDEDATLVYDINASDVDVGDVLSYTSNITLLGGSIDANGILTWTPVNADVGVHDIIIEVCDDSGAANNCTSDVINITVINTNDAPVFDHILEDQIVDEDSTLIYDINASDVDVGDVLTYTSNVTLLGGAIDANTGILTWTPDNSNVRDHLVEVIVCDDSGALNNCTTDSFTVTVNNTNDAPVAYDVFNNTDEDVEIIVTLNHSDVDVGDLAETANVTNVVGGTITQAASCSAGVCTVGLTPLQDSAADITANYTVNDGEIDSNVATITVTVNSVNDAPYFDPALINQTINEDSTLIYDINVSDVDSTVFSFTSDITLLGGAIDANTGVLTWTPDNSNVGNNSINVTACDDSGALNNCTTDSFIVIVVNTNDAPVAYDVVDNIDEDVEVIVTLNYTDIDVGDLAETANVTNVVGGTITQAASCSAGICTVGLTPLLDSAADITADYTINDGDVDSNLANITVTINAVNDAPVAYDVVDSGDEDVEVIVTLNYTDVESDPATSCTLVGAVVGGTETTSCACAGGVCTVGLTSLSESTNNIIANYTVNDGILDSNTASITVTLNAVNDAPVFDHVLEDQAVDEDYTVTYDINASDVDVGDVLSYSSNVTALGGSIDSVTGILTWTPDNSNVGDHLVEVIVCDDSGAANNCTSDTFTITVNDIPFVVFTTGPYTSNEGSAVNFSGFAAGGSVPYYYRWDFDNDGTFDTAWSLTSDVSNTWNDDFSGIALLQVNDSIDTLANDTTTVTINNVAPTANANGPYNCMDGDSITLNGSATDPAGVNDILNYTWDLDNDGIYETNIEDPTYTCNIGVSSVNLSVTDGDGGLDIATATINVVTGLIANTQGPYLGNEGSAVVFSGAASGGYLPYSYRWDLDGDGTWDTTWNLSNAIINTWLDDYAGTIALQVNDSTGHLANDTTTVTVNNVAPTANANGPYLCTMGQNITLTGSATDPGNDTISYAWDLDNDGTYEIAGTTANFSCTSYGLYPVNFSASDEDGGVGVDSTYIFVSTQNMTADAQGPYTGVEGSPIAFSGSVSGGLIPHQYRWDFDNDGTYDTAWSSTPDASYAYPDDYNDVAVLQVNDSLGIIAIDTSSVNVSNLAPTADADGPYSCIIGQNITLTGSATDPGTGDTHTYEWDLDNDSTYEAPGQNVIFQCTANGTYQVNLMVTDDDSGVAYDSSSVSVSIPTLLVDANGPYMGAEGFAITGFTGSASGGTAPYQYRWDFNNDGTYDTAWASTADASTTYNDDYSGVAVLEVMDSASASATDTASVTVNNIAPTTEANGPYTCNEGEIITLTGSATDPGTGDVLTFDWDLNNDATYETPGQYPTYTCGVPGLYTVGLRVSDDDGGSSTDTAVISVGTAPDIVPPTVVINSPQPIIYTTTNLSVSITASDASGISSIWYTINGGAPIDYYSPVNQIFGDNAAYTLTAYASDMIGNVGSASVVFTVNSTYGIVRIFDEPKPRYIAKLDRIRMTGGGFLNIGEDLRTTITLSNIGDKDLEDATITVVVPELGIWKKIGPLDLDKGDKETREVILDMPDDVEPGEYMARIVVSNSKVRRVVHRPIIIE